MSTTSKRSAVTRRQTSPSPAETRRSSVGNVSPDEEAIRCRAYELYLARGDQPGSALDDWLQAERELGRTS
jgi:Protein of unknown function (DUF2934)